MGVLARTEVQHVARPQRGERMDDRAPGVLGEAVRRIVTIGRDVVGVALALESVLAPRQGDRGGAIPRPNRHTREARGQRLLAGGACGQQQDADSQRRHNHAGDNHAPGRRAELALPAGARQWDADLAGDS